MSRVRHRFRVPQVSCQRDFIKSTPALPYFWRTLSMTNCSRSFVGSLSVATDQQRWDSWLSDWKTSYMYAAAGVLAESLWDLVEVFAYMLL
jgi:hypothetical protein